MKFRELFVKDKTRLSRAELVRLAYQYFLAYQSDLTSGGIKEKIGAYTISITFVVNEEKDR